MGKGESRKSYVVIVELVDPRLAMVVEDQNGRNHVLRAQWNEISITDVAARCLIEIQATVSSAPPFGIEEKT